MSSNTVTALMATAAESKHNMLCSVHFWGCIGNPSETRRELWGGYLKSMEFDVPASETRRKLIGRFSVYIIAIWLSLETSLLVGTMSSDQAGKPNWLTLVSSTHSIPTCYP